MIRNEVKNKKEGAAIFCRSFALGGTGGCPYRLAAYGGKILRPTVRGILRSLRYLRMTWNTGMGKVLLLVLRFGAARRGKKKIIYGQTLVKTV
jgi:hypothetical protein